MHPNIRPIRLFLLCLSLGTGLPVAAMGQDLRIERVTIVSPERASPMGDVDVTIHDGRIASISSGTSVPPSGTRSAVKTIDGRGLYLAPGLIDSHVHLGSIPGMTDAQEVQHPDIARAAWDQMPHSFLLYGFTLEMQRLVAAGETPAQIFRAATLSNAQALKLDRDVGTVQVGKRANLLLLQQDPTQTIQAYAGIVGVILGGRVLDPADLAANRAQSHQ